MTSFKVIRRVNLRNKRKPNIRELPTGGRAELWEDRRWILKASHKTEKQTEGSERGIKLPRVKQ